jgi:hypothetical protein
MGATRPENNARLFGAARDKKGNLARKEARLFGDVRKTALRVEGSASLRRYVENLVRAELRPLGTKAFGQRRRSEDARHLRR